MFATKNAAAGIAGVSGEQLGHYASGRSKPPFEVLARLAAATGTSLDWLATGEGPMLLADRAAAPPPAPTVLSEPTATAASTAEPPVAIDEDLMGRVVEGIMGVYTEMGARIGPRDVGRMATRVYTDVLAACEGPDDRPVALRLVLNQLRKDIAAPGATSSSKRLA